MTRKFWLCLAVCALALVVACARQSASPTSPTVIGAGSTGAAPDGSTLKVSAPVPQSPMNAIKLDLAAVPTLVITNSTFTYGGTVALTYRFQIFSAAGAAVYTSPQVGGSASGTTSHAVTTAALQGEQTYTWRARAEYGDLFGPWFSSSSASFVTPTSEGFIRGNEMYDPLINGKTVGEPHGPTSFTVGASGGITLGDHDAHVSYELPQTLLEGEFSLLVTDMPANTKGGKTKLFAMGQGYADIVTNEYRMTVEKRGDPPGIVAWRFIARDDQIDTEGAEREEYNFQAHLLYFWRATWQSNYFEVEIREGGFNGRTVYRKGKHWEGRGYEAKPHVLYIGAPIGRSGPDGGSVNGVKIRQVYVGPFRRPASANQ